MGVTDSWIAGREAVLAFERFCLDQRWVFHEVPGHADFGKDGYVDVVEPSGSVTGGCFFRADQGRAIAPTRWRLPDRCYREQPPPLGSLDASRDRGRLGSRPCTSALDGPVGHAELQGLGTPT